MRVGWRRVGGGGRRGRGFGRGRVVRFGESGGRENVWVASSLSASRDGEVSG